DSVTLHGAAEKLAARAIEGARRQTDNHALLAMVREQGELALTHGDRKGAEAAWSRMLEMVLPPEPARGRRIRTAPGAPAQPRPGPTTPRSPSRAGSRDQPKMR